MREHGRPQWLPRRRKDGALNALRTNNEKAAIGVAAFGELVGGQKGGLVPAMYERYSATATAISQKLTRRPRVCGDPDCC